jgi:hypothetical protein
MTYEQLEDIMDDLREIHASYCPNWDVNFVCGCPILEVMDKLYDVSKPDIINNYLKELHERK